MNLSPLDHYLRAYQEKYGSLDGSISESPQQGSARLDGIPWDEAQVRVALWEDKAERVRVLGSLSPLQELLARAVVPLERVRELWG